MKRGYGLPLAVVGCALVGGASGAAVAWNQNTNRPVELAPAPAGSCEFHVLSNEEQAHFGRQLELGRVTLSAELIPTAETIVEYNWGDGNNSFALDPSDIVTHQYTRAGTHNPVQVVLSMSGAVNDILCMPHNLDFATDGEGHGSLSGA